MDRDLVADLYYVSEYAKDMRQRLKCGEKVQPSDVAIVARMKELTERIERQVQKTLES
jgi:hypothetical protein